MFDFTRYVTLLEIFRQATPPQPPPDARLAKWAWPPLRPYNGFSGEVRVRVWQLQLGAYDAGALARPTSCALCASGSHVVFHSENYADPWCSIPLCYGCHMSVHGRFRCPGAWGRFQARHHQRGAEQWLDLLPATPIDLAGWLTSRSGRAAVEQVPRPVVDAQFGAVSGPSS
jgi:hypothetical protein